MTRPSYEAAVIGSPISHSLSPSIFRFLSSTLSTDLTYQVKEVKPDSLESFLVELKLSEHFLGVNVTLPLKEIVINLLDEVSPEALAIGAVNVIHKSGHKLIGHNTDVIGIEKTFLNKGFDVAGKSCLLWGAGGSAKAVAFVLGKLKASKVFVYNRSERGEELVKKISQLYQQTQFKTITQLEDIKNIPLSVMVNTTPLGMSGKESGMDYFKKANLLQFDKRALAFDLIYTPEYTDFLKVSSALGLETVGGLGMLIDQALATWKIWLGQLPEEIKSHHALRSFLKGILKLRTSPAPIILTGFMGVGKSVVGEELHRITGRRSLDTDKLVTTLSGKSIPELFSQGGELEFRRWETKALKEALLQDDTIISLGGGALTVPENLKLLKEKGTLVYLSADEKSLEQRISHQSLVRPLLEGLNQKERETKIASLLEARKPLYEQAQVKVETQKLTPFEVALQVISEIGNLS